MVNILLKYKSEHLRRPIDFKLCTAFVRRSVTSRLYSGLRLPDSRFYTAPCGIRAREPSGRRTLLYVLAKGALDSHRTKYA